MTKTGFIITGRMKSTRLKEKLVLKLLDREVIAWMIDRAKLHFDPKDIVIATSINPQDTILEEIAFREGISVFRGDEEDVVERLYLAAKENGFDFFINITADCPLFGFDVISRFEDLFSMKNPDLITALDLPHGFFIYGLKTSALEKVLEIKKTNQTEVWGDYFYNNPELFSVEKLPIDENEKREGYRLTLDYPEDFTFFEAVFNYFGKKTYTKSSEELLKFLDENPSVVAINESCRNRFQQRWEEQRVSNIERKKNQ